MCRFFRPKILTRSRPHYLLSVYKTSQYHYKSNTIGLKTFMAQADPLNKVNVSSSCDLSQGAMEIATTKVTSELPSGARLVHEFRVDQEKTFINDIVTLPHGLVLGFDSGNKALKLFNVQGELLQKHDTGELCWISKVEQSLVIVLYTESQKLETLNVEESDMAVQKSLDLEQENETKDKIYKNVVSVDRHRIGVSFLKRVPSESNSYGVDIYNLDGVHLTTIDTKQFVSQMCSAEDGIIFCSNFRFGYIIKIDVNKGTELFCVGVPEVPRLSGLSYLTGSQSIVVCGGKHGNLSLVDNQAKFLKELYPTSRGVFTVSVHDDTCVLEGQGMLSVLNLEF